MKRVFQFGQYSVRACKWRCLRQPTVAFVAALILWAATIVQPSAAQQPGIPHGVNRTYIDTTCAPCTDFFHYANGAWLKSVAIPRDQNWWGPGAELQQRNETVLRDILDSLAFAPSRNARSAVERKVGLFYRTCLDSSPTGADELRPLAPELRRLDTIASRPALGAAIGRLHRLSSSPAFWFEVVGDERDPGLRVGEISDGGWWLPARGQYLRNDTASRQVRDQYAAMLTRVFAVLGDSPDAATANAARVIDLETMLVRAAATLEDAGSVSGGTRLSVAQLQARAPAFDWASFFRGLGRPDMPPVRAPQPAFLSALDNLFKVVPWPTWRAYLRWRLIVALTPALQKSFDGVMGTFWRSLGGVQEASPRNTQCVRGTNSLLGMAVAQVYVARSFTPAARTKAIALAKAVRGALRERISALDWLGPTSRARALAKLDAMTMHIGYPERWPDYSTLRILHAPNVVNAMAVLRFNSAREFATMGTREDRTQWTSGSPTQAAPWYDADTNTLWVQAAYLQPPFFDERADDAENFAAVGFTIGHELTHAFGITGRRWNERGVREDWWTPDEVAAYDARGRAIVNQFDQYLVVDGVHQNGRKTLNENIADIGGTKLAYLAFRRAAEDRLGELKDHFTAEQRFFLALAQSTFRRATRPEQLRLLAENDSHAAPQWRVNGPLANMPEFAAAFGCKEGDAMVLPASARGQIW